MRTEHVILCLAVLGMGGCFRVDFKAGKVAAAPESVIIEEATHPPAQQRLFVTVHGGAQTAVAHPHRSPPPWPNGNCLTLYMLSPEQWDDMVRNKSWSQQKSSEAHLANMHAENFLEIVQRLDLKTVEVEYLEHGGRLLCFLVDARIGKEWLRSEPCVGCMPREIQESCRGNGEYAALFRLTPDPSR